MYKTACPAVAERNWLSDAENDPEVEQACEMILRNVLLALNLGHFAVTALLILARISNARCS